jgi:hypothetical protein
MKDTNAHRVGIYCMDIDKLGRQQKVEMLDAASGAVLTTTTLTNFSNGAHLVWDIKGKVRLRITPLTGNSVVSAFFFDAAPAPAPVITVGAKYLATDTATQGNWLNVYGADGSTIPGDITRTVSYATITPGAKGDWTWANPTTDVRGLLRSNGASRQASCWYASTAPITFDVNITDGLVHKMSIYMVDWDKYGRVESVEIIDTATGKVLDTRTGITSLGGTYVSWDIKGKVTVRITKTAGYNTVISGIFFDKATAQY